MVSDTIFELDDEGLVAVKEELIADDRLSEIRQAAYDCPTDSISFVEDAPAE